MSFWESTKPKLECGKAPISATGSASIQRSFPIARFDISVTACGRVFRAGERGTVQTRERTRCGTKARDERELMR